MPTTLGILASGQVASSNTDTTLYTVASSSSVKVASMSITNTATTQAVTVSVSVVPSGASLDATRKIVADFALAPGDSTRIDELVNAFIGAGSLVSIRASASGVINFLLTGAVLS